MPGRLFAKGLSFSLINDSVCILRLFPRKYEIVDVTFYYILFAICTASTITPSLSSSQEHSNAKFKLKMTADKAMLG